MTSASRSRCVDYNVCTLTSSDIPNPQFASYLADDIGSEDIEEMYTEAYEKIRENPDPVLADRSEAKKAEYKAASQKYRQKKLTTAERKQRVAKKIAEFSVGLSRLPTRDLFSFRNIAGQAIDTADKLGHLRMHFFPLMTIFWKLLSSSVVLRLPLL